MKSSGWTYRSASAVATGTVSLTVDKPAGTADNDILLLVLAHKGSTYATVPAGWTLIRQGLSGSTRGELYWKRASSEGANYSITGLATIARGVILCYIGGKLTGDIVDASSVDIRASGNQLGSTGLTTTSAQVLLVSAYASGSNETSASGNNHNTATTPFDGSSDIVFTTRASSFAATCSLVAYDACKVVPGATLDAVFTGTNFSGERVHLFAALLADTSSLSSGTRYYLGLKAPLTRPLSTFKGGWDASVDFTGNYNVKGTTFLLSQTKPDGGRLIGAGTSTTGIGWNQTSPARLLFYRWKTPPLDAQTISGTVNVVMRVSAQAVGSAPAPTAKFRLHIYVTAGATHDVRATLLSQTTDASGSAWTTFGRFEQLSTPLSLTSQTCQAGDSVMVELGCDVTFAGSFPAPTRPITDWIAINFSYGTAVAVTQSGVFNDCGVGALDGVVGDTASGASFLDFSHTFTEQAYSGTPPANVDVATATTISSLPFTATVETSQCPSPQRRVWYKYTPAQSQRIYVRVWGSPCNAVFGVRFGSGGDSSLTALSSVDAVTSGHGLNCAAYDLTAGTTYYIFAGTSKVVQSTRWGGGTITLSISAKTALADGDVFIASSGTIARYTSAGVLAELCIPGVVISGLAIDNTRRPMTQRSGGTHTGPRLLYALHDFDFVGVLDLAELHTNWADGIDIIATVLDAHPGAHAASISVNGEGQLAIGFFGNGYCWASGGSTGSAVTYLDRAATLSTANLALTDATFGDAATHSAAGSLTPALDVGGMNYVEHSPDGTVLWYVSAGWYHPIGGQKIKRWDLTTQAQLADFLTVPTGPGPNPGLKGLFPLPDTANTPGGGVLICNGAEVRHYNGSGTLVRTFAPAGAVCLTDVELSADARYVWFHDEATLTLYKYDITTGGQSLTVNTGQGAHATTSLVVYRSTAFPTVTYQSCPCPDDPWTLSLMRGQLSARLHDPSAVRWPATELNRIIWEALRTWNAFTGWAIGRASFLTTPGEPFYQLSTILPTLRGPDVSDSELYAGINSKLLETVALTPQFVQDFLTKSYGRRHQNILIESGVVVVRRLETVVSPSADGRYPLDPCILHVRRVAWSENGNASTIPLLRDDQWSQDHYIRTWPQRPERRPRFWSMSTRPPQYLQLGPIPTHAGQLDFVCIIDCTPIPPDWTWITGWGVLADLLGQSGPGHDPARADYAEQRYKHGIEAMKAGPVVHSARVNGNLVPINATPDLDVFRRLWQTTSGRPRELLTYGQTLVGLSPVPDSIYTVLLDVVQIAPLPLNDSDLVYLPPAARDPVLDYCEHLALFKEGPGELQSSLPLLDRFFRAAGVRMSIDTALTASRGPIDQQSSHDQRLAPHHIPPEPTLILGVGEANRG